MLNIKDDILSALAAGRRDEVMAEVQADFNARMKYTERVPYCMLSRMALFVYLAGLLTTGLVTRILRRSPPDRLVQTLAEEYKSVPEMVLHKAIELRSFARRSYSGRGLDLGCGDGIIGGILAQEMELSDLHGVDISPVAEVSILSRGYTGYRVADIQQLPDYSEGEFDYIISVCVIEHVPDLDAVLSQAQRVLKPGAPFYFTTPSPEFHSGLLVPKLLRAIGRPEAARQFMAYKDLMACQYHYLSPEQWHSKLEQHGFTDIVVEPLFTRRQLLAYDLMNVQVYVPQILFYPHLARWIARLPVLGSLIAWSTASLCQWIVEQGQPRLDDQTHFSIACRKA